MGRRTLLLIVSILIAAVGTALIAIYVRGADERAKKGTEQVAILVVDQAVPAGTKAEDAAARASFRSVSWARADAPKDAISDIGQVDGLTTNTTLVVGAPVQKSMFSKSASESTSIGISPGKVGAAFQLTDPQRVAGLLEPGTFVSIFAVPDKGQSYTIISRAKVLQIGTQTTTSSRGLTSSSNESDPNADQVPRTVVTFDLTEKQELDLLTADRDGDLAVGVLYDQAARDA